MKLRILVNLGFFAALGVALGIWAISDVLQIDLADPPYEITADFEDSPGLQPGYDVGYLGTPIGRIADVELADGHVEVTLAIEDGREIPRGSSFAVRRKSAVGEPYVDITPPEGAGPDAPAMVEGDHVPMARTVTPLSYSELFSALNDLVATVPEDDLGILLHEFAAAVDGRSGSIRDLIVGSDDALATFAENADLLESSTASLSRLARVFAAHRTSLDRGLANTEVVTGSLANARADLERLLVDGDSLATRTADLLDSAGDDLSCVFGGLSSVVARLDRPELRAALQSLLATAPDAHNVFEGPDSIVAWETDGPYIRAVPPLNIGGTDPVPVYPEPRSLPEIPGAVPCPEVASGDAPGDAATAGPGGTPEVDGAQSPASDPGAGGESADELASSDQATGGDGFNPLWIVIALLIVAVIAAVRPWRVLPGRR